MTTVTGRIVQGEDCDILVLPRDVAFGRELAVTIERLGDVLTVRPALPSDRKRPSIAEMLATLDALPKPTEIQERDDIWPERQGL